MTSLYDFTATTADGQPLALAQFRGQVLLIVNVASECGFTGQYEGLRALHERYKSQGFSVLAFPCNQFRRQEPGSDRQILEFCTQRFGVTFPVFRKTDVNGAAAHPLFHWLKQQKSGILGSRRIKWNFTKFLIGRDGRVRARYAPATAPRALIKPLEAALSELQPIGTRTFHDD